MDSPGKKVLVVFVILFALSTTVNMTLSPSLLANGRQLGCSEPVISHCPLCPVKLSTKFCMKIICEKRKLFCIMLEFWVSTFATFCNNPCHRKKYYTNRLYLDVSNTPSCAICDMRTMVPNKLIGFYCLTYLVYSSNFVRNLPFRKIWALREMHPKWG